MGLVDYPGSDEDADEDESVTQAVAKKQQTSHLPPLPANFLDLYSSTVRTSTFDDPSLHGGRKRVTPHVQGNWPTHVYLEWNPPQAGLSVLSDLVAAAARERSEQTDSASTNEVSSLLSNDLGVSLPLHISLSRPLLLRTEQKDDFLARMQSSLRSSGVYGFCVRPQTVQWHPNEDGSRFFLVLRLTQGEKDELGTLLQVCNETASDFGQPQLYEATRPEANRAEPVAGHTDGKFHISLAWSLVPAVDTQQTSMEESETNHFTLDATNLESLKSLNIWFDEVKVRIGQDVTPIALGSARKHVYRSLS